MKKKIAALLTAALMAVSVPASVFAGETGSTAAGAGLQKEETAFVIGGNQITKGRGFLHNVAWITEEDMEKIYNNNSGEATYRLGLGDSFTESVVRYSTYENHGDPEWIYRSTMGLDIGIVARTLGIQTDQRISVTATSTDGMSKTISDAFGAEQKRYCFDTSGKILREVDPIIALYQTTAVSKEAPGIDPDAAFPVSPETGSSSKDRIDPLFGYGQTKADEINSCYWIKDTNRLRIGSEDVALTVMTADKKKVTSSLSGIISGGVYMTSYSYGAETHKVTGAPLDVVLKNMNAAVLNNGSLILRDTSGAKVEISAKQAGQWFVAWEASQNGMSVKNGTALRLYGPQQQVGDFSSVEVSTRSLQDPSQMTAAQQKELLKSALKKIVPPAEAFKLWMP